MCSRTHGRPGEPKFKLCCPAMGMRLSNLAVRALLLYHLLHLLIRSAMRQIHVHWSTPHQDSTLLQLQVQPFTCADVWLEKVLKSVLFRTFRDAWSTLTGHPPSQQPANPKVQQFVICICAEWQFHASPICGQQGLYWQGVILSYIFTIDATFIGPVSLNPMLALLSWLISRHPNSAFADYQGSHVLSIQAPKQTLKSCIPAEAPQPKQPGPRWVTFSCRLLLLVVQRSAACQQWSIAAIGRPITEPILEK